MGYEYWILGYCSGGVAPWFFFGIVGFLSDYGIMMGIHYRGIREYPTMVILLDYHYHWIVMGLLWDYLWDYLCNYQTVIIYHYNVTILSGILGLFMELRELCLEL